MTTISIKRIYEVPQSEDGFRVLVDRIWPRGMTKEKAALDLWAKDIAPSSALRKWFNHDISKWSEFENRYRGELVSNEAAILELMQKAAQRHVTLLYGARDEQHNQAVVLRDFIQSLT
ncbi:DUF488 domain-containing protein [Brucella pituitosa]|uniref:DUF488 domain-containing protein n=1 Tax=Brucella pituitosa TaxID=571256 RepID=A0ABS3K3I3_9HYPH|nr:DUF488 domain-containing protein [Brucella pituitosa]MBO1040356.1 DUF488 domain-containing protein [Brucella pituitosa]